MNIEEAVAIFENFNKRAVTYETMGESLRNAPSPKERLQRFQKRSQTTFEFYLQNQADIKQLFSWIRGELDTVPSDDDFLALFEQTRKLYLSAYGDMFLLQELVQLLLPHFEEKHDSVHMMFLYLCLAFVNLEVSRIIHDGYGEASMDYYRKILALAKQVDQKDYIHIYHHLAVSYANLLMVETCLHTISMDKGYEYWLEAKKLRNSPELLAHMDLESTAKSAALLDRFISRFETESYDIYRNNHIDASPKMVEWMEEQNETEFKRVSAEDPELLSCSCDLLITHIEYLLDHNQITADEAISVLDSYVDKRRPLLVTRKDDIVSFYITYTQEILVLLTQSKLSLEKQKEFVEKYTEVIESFIRDYTHDANFAYSLNNALWVIAFQPEFYRYIPSPEEKIDRLYRFVVTRHLTTYLHSQMVAYFAETILGSVLEKRPDLFIGFHELKDVDDVLNHKETLLRFAKNAALLHDVGKNSMIYIIDTQTRPLFDSEFKLICAHPTKGAELLSFDDDFRQFRDIAWGHHKFYNGKGGYPADFDNTASPDRIMIDLITLCDCLDAATDTLGRNYRRAKTVHQVAEEFLRDAGTRYNPDLAALIASDEELLTKLEDMTVSRRKKLVMESSLISD